ncbi:MAG: B12-binding domain-containing radical SAM protein [Nanobdellota archaeon]
MTIINVTDHVDHPQDLKPVLQLEQFAHLTGDQLIDTRFTRSVHPGEESYIYFKTPALQAAIRLATHIKDKHNTKVIGIGPHASRFPDSLVFDNSPFDGVHPGTTDSMSDIINATGEGAIDRFPIITDYSYPYKSTYPTRLARPRYGYLFTSYGCNHTCTFCTPLCVKETGAETFRPHSREYILTALQKNIAAGKNIIHFLDDNFTQDPTRVLTLCKDIKRQGLTFRWIAQGRVDEIDETMLRAMKDAGCECLKLGVESGSPKDLIKLNKTKDPKRWINNYYTITRTARNLNLPIIAMFMFGIPGQEPSDTRQTLQLIARSKPFLIQLHRLVDYQRSKSHHYELTQDIKSIYWNHLTSPSVIRQHLRFIPHYLRTLPTTLATLRMLNKRI